MARRKITPQFTTLDRNKSGTADKSRTSTFASLTNRPFTFLKKAGERNKVIDARAPGQRGALRSGGNEIDAGFKALTYPEFGNAADGGHAIVFKINRAVSDSTAMKKFQKNLPGTNTGASDEITAGPTRRNVRLIRALEAQKRRESQQAAGQQVGLAGAVPGAISALENVTLGQGQLFSKNASTQQFSAVASTRDSGNNQVNFDVPKRRLDTAIVLYMPPQIQTTYTLNYSDVDMGFMAQAMVGVFDAMGGKNTELSEKQLTAFIKKGALATLNTAAPGAAAGLQIRMGAVISNKMELSFTGITRREFQFVFNFTPKSENEANTIRDIITTFKYYAHPSFLEGTGGNMMSIPDSFDIEYRSHGRHNEYLHKISTCFCSRIDVQYGGDRFTAHKHVEGRGSPPSKTILSLTFKEMELITKSRIDEGY